MHMNIFVVLFLESFFFNSIRNANQSSSKVQFYPMKLSKIYINDECSVLLRCAGQVYLGIIFLEKN